MLGPDQREGAECFLSFLLREVLFWFLPSDAEGLFPPIHPRISPKVSNPTHRFCYRATKSRHGIVPAGCHQYSDGRSSVVTLRSASVIIQSLTPVERMYAESSRQSSASERSF